MDRLTASSIDPPPDWPLPSLPLPSLLNVSKESKRHCRILPAGMVSLSLTQMADAAAHEEQKKLQKQHKKLDYKKVEFTERDFEKWAFECKKTQKKRNLQKQKTAEEQKPIEPHSFDEMLESVDALLLTLDSPTATTKPQKPSKATISNPPPSPTASTIAIAEQSAGSPPCPSPFSPGPKPQKALLSLSHPTPSAPPLPLDPTTALHSHPPSSSDLAFARNLTTAHHKHSTSQKITHSHSQSPSQRRLLPLLPPHPLAAFDAITEYGKLVRKTSKSQSPLSFSGAVNKGFGEVVLVAAKAGRKARMRKEEAVARAREGKVKFREAVGREVRGFFG